MLTETELIRNLDFFEPLDHKVLKRIAKTCIAREFSAGDYIVRQGESGLGLYFITGGRAKVEIEREGMKVVVAELKEGYFLGELSIIDDKARSANVICIEDTRCLLLTRDDFSKLIRKHPEIMIQMVKSLVGRIRSTNDRLSQAVPAAEAPAAAPAAASPPPADTGDRLNAATDKITAVIPSPEDLARLYSSSKGKVRDLMIGMVGSLYGMKAMTRFMVAVVGCPVRVSVEAPSAAVLSAHVGDVTLLLFPAAPEQTLRIEAYDAGEFSATVFSPACGRQAPGVSVLRLEGQVRKAETLRLHMGTGKRVGPECLESDGPVASPRLKVQCVPLRAPSGKTSGRHPRNGSSRLAG